MNQYAANIGCVKVISFSMGKWNIHSTCRFIFPQYWEESAHTEDVSRPEDDIVYCTTVSQQTQGQSTHITDWLDPLSLAAQYQITPSRSQQRAMQNFTYCTPSQTGIVHSQSTLPLATIQFVSLNQISRLLWHDCFNQRVNTLQYGNCSS